MPIYRFSVDRLRQRASKQTSADTTNFVFINEQAEVPPDLAWNVDGSSKLCLFDDNVLDCLRAISMAKQIRVLCQQRARESGKTLDASYQVQIVVFSKVQGEVFTEYTPELQANDLSEILRSPPRWDEINNLIFLERCYWLLIMKPVPLPGTTTEKFMDFLIRQDRNGLTPIHWARKLGEQRLLNLWYQKIKEFYEQPGFKPNANTMSHLFWAVALNQTIRVQTTVIDMSLRTAVRYGHIDGVERLLEQATRDNRANDINSADDSGSTALKIAASHGYADIVKMLVAYTDRDGTKICNVNAHDSRLKSTALHEACIRGHVDVIRVLLAQTDDEGKNTCNVNCSNTVGLTPLDLAINGGFIDTVLLLLAHTDYTDKRACVIKDTHRSLETESDWRECKAVDLILTWHRITVELEHRGVSASDIAIAIAESFRPHTTIKSTAANIRFSAATPFDPFAEFRKQFSNILAENAVEAVNRLIEIVLSRQRFGSGREAAIVTKEMSLLRKYLLDVIFEPANKVAEIAPDCAEGTSTPGISAAAGMP